MDPVAVGDAFLCVSENGAPEALAVVGRIDRCADLGVTGRHAGMRLVHVATFPVGGAATASFGMSHAPYAMDAFLRYARERVERGRAVPSGFEEGYATWRKAWQTGEAGWFTISPADVLRMAAAARTEGQSVH